MIHIKCPKCGDYLSVTPERIGHSETCPNCGNITIIPDVFSSSGSLSRDSGRRVFLFGMVGGNDPANAWVFGTAALGAVVGALIGAPTVDPEDSLTGIMLGGFAGTFLGILVGAAIAYGSKSRR
jgi:hypothetical protein